MDDDELIARLAGGDDTALRELFSRHAPWLAARLRTKLPAADVEDVLQETFLAVWRGAATYRPQTKDSAGGWIWGVARRQAAMWLRRQGRENAGRENAGREDGAREDEVRGDAVFLHASTTSAAPPRAPHCAAPGAPPGSALRSTPGSVPGSTPGWAAGSTAGSMPGSAQCAASDPASGSAPRAAVPRRFDQDWSDPPSPEDAEAAAIARMDLAAAVESLGPPGVPEREVWQLLYVEDRPVAQVAAMLGVPEGTVKSRGHRARRLLKAALLGRPAARGERARSQGAQDQAAQGGSVQGETAQGGSVQGGTVRGGTVRRGPAQRGPTQYGSGQLGSAQYGSAQYGPAQGGAGSP